MRDARETEGRSFSSLCSTSAHFEWENFVSGNMLRSLNPVCNTVKMTLFQLAITERTVPCMRTVRFSVCNFSITDTCRKVGFFPLPARRIEILCYRASMVLPLDRARIYSRKEINSITRAPTPMMSRTVSF